MFTTSVDNCDSFVLFCFMLIIFILYCTTILKMIHQAKKWNENLSPHNDPFPARQYI